MTRPVKLVSPGVAADLDLPQPFGDKQLNWETRQGHRPGRGLSGEKLLHKSGVTLAEPPRRDLGFAPRPGVRLVSPPPDPRLAGQRGIGDELKDLKDGMAALWTAVAALQRLAGVEIPPEPAAPAVAPSSEPDADGMRWDDPDLTQTQRIDAAMSQNLAALRRGGIKSFRR